MNIFIRSSLEWIKVKVWVFDEEKALVEDKAYNYSYKRLEQYISDTVICERVTKENVKA